MEIKRAIISGATGAIGTALTQLLIDRGIEVLILTRADSKRNHVIPRHPLVRVKMCDFEHLFSQENDTGVQWDCFFHLAWAGASGQGRNDMFLQNHNVTVALEAVSLAKRFGCTKFVGAGSQAEYGCSAVKLTSKTPVFPEMGYGYAKLCAGLMTRDYAHQLGMAFNWLRILSIFGPHDGPNSMISQAITQFERGVSGEYTRGEQIWDYVYSKDAANAFVRVAERGIDGKTYVLGSGAERPLAEYLLAVRDMIAPNVDINLGARPYGERQVMYLAADVDELRNDTGYEAAFTFEQGVADMLKCAGVDLDSQESGAVAREKHR